MAKNTEQIHLHLGRQIIARLRKDAKSYSKSIPGIVNGICAEHFKLKSSSRKKFYSTIPRKRSGPKIK